MAFDLLPSLRPRQWRSTICVRVARKWEYRGGTDDGPVQHIDLVLIDENGNTMYGEITEPDVETKGPLVQEGGIYVISRFRVSNAKSGYRPCDSSYMVEFTLHTTVSPARTDMPGFPQYAYRLTPIDALASRAGDTRNFIDTMGILVEVSEAYTVRLPNKSAPTLTRHIVLRDLSHSEIKITLWGNRAAAFTTDGVYNKNEANPIVVLFVGGLVKSYQGTYYLSANAASRWYFNPPIPEARAFTTGCQGQKIEIAFVQPPRESQSQNQAPKEREEKTLAELNSLDPYDFSEYGYRCTVTIGRLTPNASWWFPSCTKCSKSCVPEGAGYRCNTCSTTSFKFKYKISFVAFDGTDEAEMVCFGDVARRIVGKPVQQLLRSSTGPNTYPPEIARIVSLRFTFAIALTQQSYYKREKTYQVISMINAAGRRIEPAQSNSEGGQSSSQATSHGIAGASQSALSSRLLTDTPPPATQVDDPPSVKSQARSDLPGKKAGSNAKRKLQFDSEEATEALSDALETSNNTEGGSSPLSNDMSDKSDELAPGGKRACLDTSITQQSG